MTVLRELRAKGWEIEDSDIECALSEVYWPGRFEVLSKDPIFVLDGAHNAHGIRAAVEGIKELLPDKKLIFVMGVMADKDIDDMLPQILPFASEFITLTPHNPRSMISSDLAAKIERLGVKATAYGDIEEGVAAAIDKARDGRAVFALGSLYFSADVKNAAKKALNGKNEK